MLRVPRNSLFFALLAGLVILFVGPPAEANPARARGAKKASSSRSMKRGPKAKRRARSMRVKRDGRRTNLNRRRTNLNRQRKARKTSDRTSQRRPRELGDASSTRLAGGPLAFGTYRVTRDGSHATLSGPLKKRANDVVFTLKDGTVTFGGNSVGVSGTSVKLKPQVKRIDGKMQTVGWSGEAKRYDRASRTEHTVQVHITGHSYRSVHPGLRRVEVTHQATSGFRKISSNSWSGAGWRDASAD